ncbi:MAG: hypothetical protein IJK34_01295 [Clostridia bacterium]|nr:hypothetical protein [Clostridia bacterium]
MMLVIVGLIFILFRFDYSFFSYNVEASVAIDVLPDFVGYLLIWFGLEKSVDVNRWFKEAHSAATGMMLITFITLVSSLSFLLEPLLESPDGQIFAILFYIINYLVRIGGSILTALTMVFMFMLASAIGYSMQSQEWMLLCRVMYVFSIAYSVLAVVYIVNQFINLPLPLDWITAGINVIFILFSYISMNKIKELA